MASEQNGRILPGGGTLAVWGRKSRSGDVELGPGAGALGQSLLGEQWGRVEGEVWTNLGRPLREARMLLGLGSHSEVLM